MDERRTDLIAQLQSHQTSLEGQGRGGQWAQMMELARSSGPVFSRRHWEPGHFTASGFVLSEDGSQLLLILHKKLRLWLQPGGHVELGDVSWQAASRREIAEETGLVQFDLVDELIDIDIHQIPQLGSEAAHFHFDLRALYRASSIEVRPGDGVLQARWFPLRDILECAGGILADQVGTDESVTRVALLLQGASR